MSSANYQRASSCDDWVWVKEKIFSVNDEEVNPEFFVAWNETENLFAITSRHESRKVDDKVEKTKSGLFSVEALHSIHHTLHGLNSSINGLPSCLPKVPKGLNSIFQGMKFPKNMKKVCTALEQYFCAASQAIGGRVLQEVMFEMASEELDHYYEKMSDINKQELYDKILYAEDELKNIAFERENCTVMKDLEDIYQREDESAVKLISSFAEYYNFLLQPYLDSESLANKKIQEFRRKMTDENLAESVLNEYKESNLYWACLLMQTKEVIQNLYIDHRTAIVSIFKELLEQINIDKKNYGSNAFDLVAANRELHLKKELYTNEEQLLQGKRKRLKLEKDRIEIQCSSPVPGPSSTRRPRPSLFTVAEVLREIDLSDEDEVEYNNSYTESDLESVDDEVGLDLDLEDETSDSQSIDSERGRSSTPAGGDVSVDARNLDLDVNLSAG